MHVILITVGTDGDVFPYVGLGAKLRERGHEVTLTASAQYESLAATHGFEFRPLVSEEEHHELFSHPDFWNPLKTAPRMARWGVRFLERQYQLLAGLVRAETVMVASPGVLASAMVHEKLRVPWATLILQPWMIPSSIVWPVMPGLTWLHRAPLPMWKLFCRGLDLLGYFLIERRLNRLRHSHGLRPVRRIFWNWLSPQLVLGMFPEWFGQPQADWPPQMRLTGFPMFDGQRDNELSPNMGEFLEAGTPPIAFTFGTGMAHPEAMFQAALEASNTLECRAVFLTKFRHQLPDSLPPTVIHSSGEPFQKLFPRCAAVVHHGGIGTTAKALAAGVPQLIRPLCFDQVDNGVRVKALGVGDWINARAGGREIASALRALIDAQTGHTVNRCRELAERFHHERGLDTAADQIENLSH